MVVYGLDGLDGISISGETLIGELAKGEINESTFHPSQVGMELFDRRAIQVGTVEESKAMIVAALENQPGPAQQHRGAERRRGDLPVAGVAPSFKAGVERAQAAIKSGAAKQKLEDYVAFTNKLKA